MAFLLPVHTSFHLLEIRASPVSDVPAAALLSVDLYNRTCPPRVIEKVAYWIYISYSILGEI